MHVVASRVFPDEACYGLTEGPENGRWVQKVFVVRGDRKAKYITDFGPASDFPHAAQIIYPSFGENTVAELQALAERDRHDDKWYKRRKELQSESTLISDILRQEEQLLKVRRNQSHFGPTVSTQRDDYPSVAVARQFKEKRNGRRSRNSGA